MDSGCPARRRTKQRLRTRRYRPRSPWRRRPHRSRGRRSSRSRRCTRIPPPGSRTGRPNSPPCRSRRFRTAPWTLVLRHRRYPQDPARSGHTPPAETRRREGGRPGQPRKQQTSASSGAHLTCGWELCKDEVSAQGLTPSSRARSSGAAIGREHERPRHTYATAFPRDSFPVASSEHADTEDGSVGSSQARVRFGR